MAVRTATYAFTTAYGGGASVLGGSGKTPYHVTNLNDSGSGSFRQAAADAVSNGGGHIIFDVGGTIELQSTLQIGSDGTSANNITISGHTAPDPGITICGGDLIFRNAHHIIVRYIRVRNDNNTTNTDTIQNASCTNMIFDHVSATWGRDEVIDFRKANTVNITVQKCLFAESKTGCLLGDTADFNSCEDMSWLSNAMYNISHRFPNPYSDGRVDVDNNVIFNHQDRLCRTSGDVQLNYRNNLIIGGVYLSSIDPGDGIATTSSGTKGKSNCLNTSYTGARVYTDGNKVIKTDSTVLISKTQDDWDNGLWHDWSEYLNESGWPTLKATETLRTGTAHAAIGRAHTLTDVDSLLTTVMDDVGAYKTLNADGSVTTSRDNVDTTIRSNILGMSASSFNEDDFSGSSHWTTFWNSVSSTPTGTRPGGYYSTNAHIPETWGQANITGFDADSHNDLAPSGYTWMEEFLNQVDGEAGGSGNTLNDLSESERNMGKRRLVKMTKLGL